MKRYNGFSLIEMMIAITVSLFLLMMLGDVFFSMKKIITEQEEMAAMESQALQVMRYLNQLVPYAGFIGCFNVNRNYPVINHLTAEESNVTAASVLINNKDSIVIKLVENSVIFSEPMANDSDIIVSPISSFQKNDVVVIGDCTSAEVDKIAAIRKIINKQAYKITLEKPLLRRYQPYATIAVLHRYRFFIKPASYDKNSSALFMAEDHSQDQELVSDVNDLEFKTLPNDQPPKAVIVNFKLKIPEKNVESVWQFVIPLLERM